MSEITTRVQPKRTCKSSTVDIVLDEEEDPEEFKIPLICELCGHRFASEIQLFRHEMYTHNEKKRKKRTTEKHMFMHDGKKRRGRKRKYIEIPPPEKRFKCDICESSFIQEETLQMHLTSHESETFSCKTCLADFPTLGSLQKHTLLKHTPSWDDEPKPKIEKNIKPTTKVIELVLSPEKHEIYIPGSTKKFSDDDVVAIREKALMHVDRELFQCEHCGAFFRVESNYENHLLAHDFTRKVKNRPLYVKRIRTLEASSMPNQCIIDQDSDDSLENEIIIEKGIEDENEFLTIEPLLECELQEDEGNDFTFTQK